jgi:hypothetical protein
MIRVSAGNPRQGATGRRWRGWCAAKGATPTMGHVVKITPTSVAREAGRSRNPLYTSHRDILDEIEAAAGPGTPARDLAARIATLETELTHLRADAWRHAEERRELASENLTLLHRARSAEDRLTALLRRMPETPTAGAIMQPR